MKATRLALLLVFSHCVSAYALQVGDSFEMTIKELGEPTGSMDMGEMKFMYFDRGKVTLSNNVVVSFSLISEEELTEREHQKELDEKNARLEQEAREQEREARRKELKEEGEVKKIEIINSPNYQMASPKFRVNMWKKFVKKYPEVNVSSNLLTDLKLMEEAREEEAEKTRLRQKLAEMEKRLEQTERIAAVSRYQTTPGILRVVNESPTPVIYWPSYIRDCPSGYYNSRPLLSVSGRTSKFNFNANIPYRGCTTTSTIGMGSQFSW